MSVLHNIRLFFQRRALKRLLEKQPPRRGIIHYDNARTVGVLFDASELHRREQVLHFAEQLRQKGKKVSLLGFFDHPVESSDFVFPVFMETDFNWRMQSKSEAVNQFVKAPFDVLIHANTQSGMYEAYVAAASPAGLRVGPYTGQTEYYELMADTSGNQDLAYYLKQVEFLLQKTNARHEAA